MKEKDRYVITGRGAITTLGNANKTLEQIWKGELGLKNVRFHRFPDSPIQVAGMILGYDDKTSRKTEFLENQKIAIQIPRTGFLAAISAREALIDAGINPIKLSEGEREKIGVFMGTCTAGQESLAREIYDRTVSGKPLLPSSLLSSLNSGAAMGPSVLLNLQGPVRTIAAECASSGLAIEDGINMLKATQDDDRVLQLVVGGSEDLSDGHLISFFDAVRAISHQSDSRLASRPCHPNRDGFVPAEASISFVLERLGDASKRKAKIYAEILGIYSNSDGYNKSLTMGTYDGLRNAIQGAIENARLSPDQIDSYWGHFTSTPQGDERELSIVRSIWEDWESDLNIVGIKRQMGHQLGASTAMSVLGITEEFIRREPPKKSLIPEGGHINKLNSRIAMAVGSGFGGQNIALVLGKVL